MIVRDAVALVPPLNGGVVAVAELARHRADTASGGDDLCVRHLPYVRNLRTTVNVENVPPTGDYAPMDGKTSLGEKLRALRDLTELSLEDVADRAGYAGKSSIQRYFSPSYEAEYLPRDLADKLVVAFKGTPVTRGHIMMLAGLPDEPKDGGHPRPWAPRPETLALLLRAAMPSLSADHVSEDALLDASHEISAALETLAVQPERERNPDVLDVLAARIALALERKIPGKARSA